MNELTISIMELFIISIPFILILAYMQAKIEDKEKKEATQQEEKEIDIENGEAENCEEYPYVKQYLLTKNEWNFHKDLKKITDKYNLHILAKVRLADIVGVKKGLSSKENYRAFSKIKAKHVDFVLAKPENLAVLCAIELDDRSHDEIDRQQRDFFLDKVCETVKLPIIHCTNINGVEDEICEKLKIHKK